MLDQTLDARAARLNERYRHHAATEVLRRALNDPDLGRVTLVSSFGSESVVLLHMVSVVAPGTPVLPEAGNRFTCPRRATAQNATRNR